MEGGCLRVKLHKEAVVDKHVDICDLLRMGNVILCYAIDSEVEKCR